MEKLRNFKLIIEYDGSGFHGWQRQKSQRTVQGDIESALETILGFRVVVNGSGRTDAGVHALAQVASFRCHTHLDAQVFGRALNSLLADDVVIHQCTEVSLDFHARYNAKAKTYHYRILNRPIRPALYRQYAWFIQKPLDVHAMEACASVLVGVHDFKAFEATGSPRSHTIREVFSARFIDFGDGNIEFHIEANGFLRYMVRNIVGTLVDAGHGVVDPDQMRRILESRDRSQAGRTAPAHGLFLSNVTY